MANLFKEFKTGQVPNLTSTGIYAIAGEVSKILGDDEIKICTKEYNKEKGQVVNTNRLVSLAAIGGTDDLKVGDKIAVLCEKNSEGDLEAKRIGIGQVYMTYKGFGISCGETTYKQRENTKKNCMEIVATVRTREMETDRTIENRFTISGYNDTKPQDNTKKTLDRQAKDNQLQQKEYAQNAFEGYPFDSAFTFKENTKTRDDGTRYDAVTAYTVNQGKYAGETRYSRSIFPYTPTIENIGSPMMDVIKEREERQAQYKESHSDEKVADAVAKEEEDTLAEEFESNEEFSLSGEEATYEE